MVIFIASNVMQIRILALQKHHDGVWIASLTLACLSILTQIGFGFVSYFPIKDDIRNRNKQRKLERYNNIGLVIIVVIMILNVSINILMLPTNSRNFLDERSLELLQPRT